MSEKIEITFRMVLDNYAVIELLEESSILPGEQFTIASLASGWNGSHVCYARPQYEYVGTDDQGDPLYNPEVPIPNQVLFAYTTANLLRVPVTGAHFQFEPTCTWVTAEQIQAWLGFTTVSIADDTFLHQCAAAANQFCWRRRNESGYADQLDVSPSGDVTLGTIMYGGALFRQRSSINEFASFSDMATATPTGLSPIIKQLLGISRPQVA